MIVAFRKLDEEIADLTSAVIRARLSGNVPATTDKAAAGGYNVLAREMQKKARHMPVRRLMGEMGESLFALALCVLMSPLSVAQFLPADQALFDLVVFD
jgi:superfamily I DNA and/or RNA helicase